MASKKTKTNEYSGFDDIKPEIKNEAQDKHIAWENKTNAQRLDSIAEYQARTINKVVSIANETNDRSGVFWEQPKNAKELDTNIPFNGSTGMPYTNLDNILMRSVMAIEGFKEPIFLTMRQANIMGGELKKTSEKTRNGKDEFVKGVKIIQLKTREFVPELDSNGKKIYEPALDKQGKEILTKKGEVALNVKGEWKELKEPMYESLTLYNIEQFEKLDKDKLKKLNLEPLYAKRAQLSKQSNSEEQFKFKFQSLEGKIGVNTLRNLREFIKATQTGKDFQPLVVNLNATKEYAQDKQKAMSR